MTTHHDEADGPTLQVVLDAVLQRNEAFERLSLILAENTAELQRTQNLLDTRPTKEDVAFHRRKAFVSVVILAFVVIFAHDEHVENCSPGVEAKAAVSYVLESNSDTFDRKELKRRVENTTPGFCTVTFPLHIHDDDRSWPNERALLGLGLYGVFFAGLATWVGVAYRRMKRVEATERSSKARNRRSGDRDPIDPSEAL